MDGQQDEYFTRGQGTFGDGEPYSPEHDPATQRTGRTPFHSIPEGRAGMSSTRPPPTLPGDTRDWNAYDRRTNMIGETPDERWRRQEYELRMREQEREQLHQQRVENARLQEELNQARLQQLAEEKKRVELQNARMADELRELKEKMERLHTEATAAPARCDTMLSLKDRIKPSQGEPPKPSDEKGVSVAHSLIHWYTYQREFEIFIDATFLKETMEFKRGISRSIDAVYVEFLKADAVDREEAMIKAAQDLKTPVESDELLYIRSIMSVLRFSERTNRFLIDVEIRATLSTYAKFILALSFERTLFDIANRSDFTKLMAIVARGLPSGDTFPDAYTTWKRAICHLNYLLGKVDGSFGSAQSDVEPEEQATTDHLSISRIPSMLLADGVQAAFRCVRDKCRAESISVHELETEANRCKIDALVPSKLKSIIDLIGKYVTGLSGKVPETPGHVYGVLKTQICVLWYKGMCRNPECPRLHISKNTLDAFMGAVGAKVMLAHGGRSLSDDMKKLMRKPNSIYNPKHCRKWIREGKCSDHEEGKCDKEHLESLKGKTKGTKCLHYQNGNCAFSADECPREHHAQSTQNMFAGFVGHAVTAGTDNPEAVAATIKRASEIDPTAIDNETSIWSIWFWDSCCECLVIGSIDDPRLVKIQPGASSVRGCFGKGKTKLCVVRLPFAVYNHATKEYTYLAQALFIDGCLPLMPPSVLAAVGSVLWPEGGAIPTLYDTHGEVVSAAHLNGGIPAFKVDSIEECYKRSGRAGCQ